MNGESNETHSNSDGMRADNSMRGRGRRWISSRFGFGGIGKRPSYTDSCLYRGCVYPHACTKANTCVVTDAISKNADIIDALGIHTKAEKSGAVDRHQQHKHQLKRFQFWLIIIGWIVGLWLIGWSAYYGYSDRHNHSRSKSAVVPQHDVVHAL